MIFSGQPTRSEVSLYPTVVSLGYFRRSLRRLRLPRAKRWRHWRCRQSRRRCLRGGMRHLTPYFRQTNKQGCTGSRDVGICFRYYLDMVSFTESPRTSRLPAYPREFVLRTIRAPINQPLFVNRVSLGLVGNHYFWRESSNQFISRGWLFSPPKVV